MPLFEIETPNGTFEVEALDENAAMKAVGAFGGADRGVPEFKPVGVEGYDPATGEVDRSGGVLGQATAAATGALDMPIVGPALKSAAAGISSAIAAPFSDKSVGDIYGEMRGLQESRMEENPGSALTGQVLGTIAGTAPVAATKLGSRALGITGENLLKRMLASGGSTAAVNATDTIVRGGGGADIVNNATIGAGIGAAIPVVGSGISAGLTAAGDRIAPFLASLRNPAAEAERRVGVAVSRDASASPQSVLSAADEQVAREANIPLLNADRGGETTRALARSVANQSPEARAAIENTASDRFAGQGARAVEFVRKLAGGNVDDLGYRELIREGARRANRPAYDRAYIQPEAQRLYTPRMQELMQSPSFRQAIDDVPQRSADRGAVEGFKEIGNPFTKNSQGNYVLRQRADGTMAVPNLQFWDQVQRNLRKQADRAAATGDRTTAGEIGALRTALLDETDAAVPAFKEARQGAAAFFAADDALEAGRKFAGQPRAIPEAKKAFEKFGTSEKQAFQAGYASELIDRIKTAGDRTNVINSTFGKQSARESIELVFGPQKAKELEAYVRVEDIVDKLRGSMGNSTTARQLVELGLGATGGYLYTNDLTGAAVGAMAARAPRYVARKADEAVMKRVADLLVSDDPKAIESAVKLAAQVPGYMQAIEKIGGALAVPARGAAMTGGQ